MDGPAARAAYVRNIEEALAERYPPHAAEFAERARRYVERLETLDREIAGALAGIERERRKLVTTHDAFRYFGRRYGLEVVATLWGISTEREPSAREIRAIVDGIREHGVRAVFVETTVNPALMLRIAQETGIPRRRPPLRRLRRPSGQRCGHLSRHDARQHPCGGRGSAQGPRDPGDMSAATGFRGRPPAGLLRRPAGARRHQRFVFMPGA